MRLLQVHTFYPEYLAGFIDQRPGFSDLPYDVQIRELIRDGFTGAHLYTPYLPAHGYECMLVVANCAVSQARWAAENGIPVPSDPRGWRALVARQIEAYRPDILYLTDPITFDSSFVRCLSWQPRLIVGWRAASISPATDWSEFDLLLSSDGNCLQRALQLGARAVEHHLPGFPTFLADAVADEPKRWDVVFCGQISPEHTRRAAILNAVGKSPLGWRGEFDIAYFLACGQPAALPAGIAMYDRGAVWGERMHRTLKAGRIVLNVHIDLATTANQNMRLFETVGTGSLLLTDESEKPFELFEPGREVETFSSPEELIEKIHHYLDHPDEREAIARRGQDRCLREHSMARRAERMDDILRRHLAAKPTPKPAGIQAPAVEPGQGLIVVTGMPPGKTGTGQMVAQLFTELRQRGVALRPFVAETWGDALIGEVAAIQEAEGFPVLLLHPQTLGFERMLALVERLEVPVLMYLLDTGFFCIRSYNHLPGQAGPCHDCLTGGAFEGIARFGCEPFPVPDPAAASFVRDLIPLVRNGRIRLLAQNPLQSALATMHFGLPEPVPVAGLWIDEMERNRTAFDNPPEPPGGGSRFDVVFHGQEHPAKGGLWALELSRRCPELRFLFPFAVDGSVRDSFPNCEFLPITWDTGLSEAVATAPLVLVPSLWSAPIEAALIKSLLFGRAVAVAGNPFTFAHELPEGLVMRLPADPAEAAPLLAEAVATRWRPDPALRKAWLAEFQAQNRSMVTGLLIAAQALHDEVAAARTKTSQA
jgi:hypothetical protein